MMNVLQLQERLKDYSQQQLAQEMQMPSGSVPQYLVLGEMQRRKRMETEQAAAQAQQNQTTVAEDAMAAAGVPQGGIAGMAQAMAPSTDMAQNTGQSPMPPMPQGPAPVQQMAGGGMVQRMQSGGPLPSFTSKRTRQTVYYDPSTYSVYKDPAGMFPIVDAYERADLLEEIGESKLGGRGAPEPKAMTDIGGLAAAPSAYTARKMMDPGAETPISAPVTSDLETLSATSPTLPGADFTPPGGVSVMDEITGMGGADDTDFDSLIDLQSALSERTDAEGGRVQQSKFPAMGMSRENDEFTMPEGLPSLADIPTDLDIATLGLPRGPDVFDERPEAAVIGPQGFDPDTDQMPPTALASPSASPLLSPLDSPLAPPLRRAAGTFLEPSAFDLMSMDENVFGFEATPRAPSVFTTTGSRGRGERRQEEVTPFTLFTGEGGLSERQQRRANKGKTPVEELEEIERAAEATGVDTTDADTDIAKPPSGTTTLAQPSGGGGGGGGGSSALGGSSKAVMSDIERAFNQDKWLALAKVGFAMMASRQPNLGAAFGEAAAAGIDDLKQARKDYEDAKLAQQALALKRASRGASKGLSPSNLIALRKGLIDQIANIGGLGGKLTADELEQIDALQIQIGRIDSVLGIGIPGSGDGAVNLPSFQPKT